MIKLNKQIIKHLKKAISIAKINEKIKYIKIEVKDKKINILATDSYRTYNWSDDYEGDDFTTYIDSLNAPELKEGEDLQGVSVEDDNLKYFDSIKTILKDNKELIGVLPVKEMRAFISYLIKIKADNVVLKIDGRSFKLIYEKYGIKTYFKKNMISSKNRYYKVILNCKYLFDILSLYDDEVSIYGKGDLKPFMVGDCLIMPIKV